MAASVPRPAKREAGRKAVADTPAHIRAIGVPLDEGDRAYLRRKLGRKLGKVAPRIERTSVRIEDVNGPRGGIDKRCRIKVVLSGLPSVVVEERDRVLQAAMDRALRRTERAVMQAVQSRRTKLRRARDNDAQRGIGIVNGPQLTRSEGHGSSSVSAAAPGGAEAQ